MEKRNPVLAESQYPLPSEAQILLVTPEMASDWISHRSYDRNRKISKVIVAKYLQDMKAGRWKTTRQGLIFDTQGKIIDGQHRLSAVANGEMTVAFWVYPNESRDTFEVLDQGYKRLPSHLLALPYASAVAAGARYLAVLADEDPWSLPRFNRVTTPEIFQTVYEWPELSRYVTRAYDVRTATSITISPHLAVLAQAARTELGTPEKIKSWMDGLVSGDNLAADDPRLHLRNRFTRAYHVLRGNMNRDLNYNLIAKAWNDYAQGRSMAQLRWRTNEGITPVVGFDWSKYNAEKESNDGRA